MFASMTAAAATPGLHWSASAAEWVVDSAAQLQWLLYGLAPGDRCLVAGSGAWRETVRTAACVRPLWWFPLEPDPGLWRAFAERPRGEAGLAAYLTREHRLIERAWAGNPEGRAFRWRLGRHMRVEEEILFPAWIERGDRPGWVRGLAAEHDLLRRPVLNSRIHRRAFRERLDSHADKEERVFYPALINRLGTDAGALLRAAMLVSV